jgi:hypothetical protein
MVLGRKKKKLFIYILFANSSKCIQYFRVITANADKSINSDKEKESTDDNTHL